MLSKISYTEKKKYCMVLPVCGVLKKEKKKNEVKGYKFSVIGRISSGVLIHMVTILNNIHILENC